MMTSRHALSVHSYSGKVEKREPQRCRRREGREKFDSGRPAAPETRRRRTPGTLRAETGIHEAGGRISARSTLAGCSVTGHAVRQRSAPPSSSRLWIGVPEGTLKPSDSPAIPAGLTAHSITPMDGMGLTNWG